MPPRFYCPVALSAPAQIRLPAEVAHHALRVLRLRMGEDVVLFDGRGGEFSGRLVDIEGETGVALLQQVEGDRESPLRVCLVQGLAVADKMDWIVQKAVETGVSVVQPVEAERSVLRLSGERAAKRVAHWRQVAVSASEQSGRSYLCEVSDIERLTHWLARPFEGERWVLDPQGGERLSRLSQPHGPVALLVGPEGGWSDAELAAARGAGCRAVAIGPRVLRTETAGVAAVAAMMALWGDY